MNYVHKISTTLNLQRERVQAALDLLRDGNTIPFIARYRKEATLMLDEEQLRGIQELSEKLTALDARRETILASIEGQGKLTEELKAHILLAESMTALEDLYQPYKPKRRTRAMIARENGLEGLAQIILAQPHTADSLTKIAKPFLNEKITSIELAYIGARDIIAEMISDHAAVRSLTREKAFQWGFLACEKTKDTDDPKRVYELYYAYETRLDRIRPHQVLAINRGEKEKVLKVKVTVPERDWLAAVSAHFRPDRRSPMAAQLELATADAAERLLLPAIERDVRRQLTENAWKHAIGVFAANLRALLSQPPLKGMTVLGIDPGFRTGCKLALIDPTGKVLATGTIYPHEPQKHWAESLAQLQALVEKHHVNLVTIGNGTASRESEQLVAELIKKVSGLHYMIVNEAGASVYSASPLAREELPGLDVSLRGAVSIARRAQDALAELVKIEPKSIGVGMYQHDVDQGELAHSLHGVVESVVNQVGVDVNTASPALLTYVAGIGPKLAEKIVEFRDQNGPYSSRDSLMKVPGLGQKTFEQSAGFLRVYTGMRFLDSTAIHPESYPVAEALLKTMGTTSPLERKIIVETAERLVTEQPVEQLAARLGVGVPTLTDIIEQLRRPGRDPREDLPLPMLRSDVLSMDDLTVGMRLKGVVRNVVDFGAFIDIGVKQDGLLHRSQLPRGSSFQTGEVIEVSILAIDKERGRISLGWAGA